MAQPERKVKRMRLGFPVVLKVHAASLVHKTDAGGVHLPLLCGPKGAVALDARVLVKP